MAGIAWHENPDSTRSVLVLALRGLFDIGEAATAGAAHLVAEAGTSTLLAEIDPESYFNFSQTRPTVHLDKNKQRRIEWPRTTAYRVASSRSETDVIVVSGTEPHLRWQRYAKHIVEIIERTQAELVVTLGATATMSPHTRPLGVVGSSSDKTLAQSLGLKRPSYEGPTGLIGVLHSVLEGSDVPTISLRVGVPHYVPTAPNPDATRSLLTSLELTTGVQTHHGLLEEQAKEWKQRVDAAVADDDEMRNYVERLEQQVDSAADQLLPCGDDLAAELESFLRSRRPDD